MQYSGEFKNGDFYGLGTLYRNKEGNIAEYIGEFKDGQFNGNGKYFEEDGKTIKYEGSWKNNKYNGTGTMYRKGSKFSGVFKNGELTDGKIILSKEDIQQQLNCFSGEVKNGEKFGYCEIYSYGKLVYEGMMKEGKMNGKGKKYSFESFDKGQIKETKILYDGSWLNDEMSGSGILYYEDFDFKEDFINFKGEFLKGKYLKGDLYDKFSGKIKYSGEFDDDYYSGKGKKYENGWIYEGEFNKGYFKKGKRYFAENKIEYDGEFNSNDEYEGYGTLYYENGKIKYKGNFKKGQLSGKGTLFDSEGKVLVDGEFFENMPKKKD